MKHYSLAQLARHAHLVLAWHTRYSDEKFLDVGCWVTLIQLFVFHIVGVVDLCYDTYLFSLFLRLFFFLIT
jgi:hypothetical protein